MKPKKWRKPRSRRYKMKISKMKRILKNLTVDRKKNIQMIESRWKMSINLEEIP